MNIGDSILKAGFQAVGTSVVSNMGMQVPGPIATGVVYGMSKVINKNNPNGGQV
jgi:hypothetical protein